MTSLGSGKRRRQALVGLCAAVVAMTASGCLATRTQVTSLEDRVVQLEKAHAGFLIAADRETKRLHTLSAEVEASTGRLGELLAKSGARLADVDTAHKKLTGRFEELDRRLAMLEKSGGANAEQLAELRRRFEQLVADLRDRAGITILALPAELPTDAAGFAKLAETKLAAGEARTAAAAASECLKRFAGTEAAGNCGLVLARIAVEEQRYNDATKQLQEVHDSLGGKPLPVVGQALIELARVMWLQGKCVAAHKVLDYVLSGMPKLVAAKTAKEMLASESAQCKEGVPATPPERTPPAQPGAQPLPQAPQAGPTPADKAHEPAPPRDAAPPRDTAAPVGAGGAAAAQPAPSASTKPAAPKAEPAKAPAAAKPAQPRPDAPAGGKGAPRGGK